jgi:hypothetical protein
MSVKLIVFFVGILTVSGFSPFIITNTGENSIVDPNTFNSGLTLTAYSDIDCRNTTGSIECSNQCLNFSGSVAIKVNLNTLLL